MFCISSLDYYGLSKSVFYKIVKLKSLKNVFHIFDADPLTLNNAGAISSFATMFSKLSKLTKCSFLSAE